MRTPEHVLVDQQRRAQQAKGRKLRTGGLRALNVLCFVAIAEIEAYGPAAQRQGPPARRANGCGASALGLRSRMHKGSSRTASRAQARLARYAAAVRQPCEGHFWLLASTKRSATGVSVQSTLVTACFTYRTGWWRGHRTSRHHFRTDGGLVRSSLTTLKGWVKSWVIESCNFHLRAC